MTSCTIFRLKFLYSSGGSIFWANKGWKSKYIIHSMTFYFLLKLYKCMGVLLGPVIFGKQYNFEKYTLTTKNKRKMHNEYIKNFFNSLLNFIRKFLFHSPKQPYLTFGPHLKFFWTLVYQYRIKSAVPHHFIWFHTKSFK